MEEEGGKGSHGAARGGRHAGGCSAGCPSGGALLAGRGDGRERPRRRRSSSSSSSWRKRDVRREEAGHGDVACCAEDADSEGLAEAMGDGWEVMEALLRHKSEEGLPRSSERDVSAEGMAAELLRRGGSGAGTQIQALEDAWELLKPAGGARGWRHM